LLHSDVEIIKAIGKGNSVVFKQVFMSNYESLCRYAFTILKNAEEAEDVVQSMFVKLWEKREELEVKHSIRSYLFKAIYHQCINQLEHRTVKLKHQLHIAHEMHAETQLPGTFQHELEENIIAAINSLPEQCRIIFMMSRYDELRYAEIAAHLNISVNTVENQISKALKILRAKLKDVIE
jgi:RNA polymerase sigma-70 factor (ECF subfamily)